MARNLTSLITAWMVLLVSICAAYPYSEVDQVYAKMIYVTFPKQYDYQGGQLGQSDTLITRDFHQEIMDGFAQYLDDHSNGKLTLAPESGILHLPGIDFIDDTTGIETWKADLLPCEYQNRPDYDNWPSTPPPDYLYGPGGAHDLSSSWTAQAGHAAPLFAEILYKIREAYPSSQNPFSSGGGERGWDLFFFFQISNTYHWNTPYCTSDGPAGGRPNVWVIPAAIDSLCGHDGYFSNLRVNGESTFGGTGQGFCTSQTINGVPTPRDYLIEAGSRVVAHEFGHALGLPDGPPNLTSVSYNEERYYYGSLNLMCQHYNPGRGIPPIADPFLPRFPWNYGVDDEYSSSVYNVTGMELHGFKIYDVRQGAQVVRIDIGSYCESGCKDQYFILAYHGGNGLDAQCPDCDPDDEPLVRAQGLAAWHCIDDDLFDLESAMGLWDFPGEISGVVTDSFVVPWEQNPPILANRLYGYDNYDLWRITENPSETERTDWRLDYGRFDGTSMDFFRPCPADSDTAYCRDEFSFATNPSTFGYSMHGEVHSYLRRRTQDVENSLVIRVLETGYDSIGDYILVDILPAPVEEILSPQSGTVVAPGDTLKVVWGEKYEGHIESVDVYYTEEYASGAWYPIALGVPAGLSNVWSWIPSTQDITAARSMSQLRIVYHNNVTDETASEYSEPFLVTGTAVPAEDIVSPSLGTNLYSNQVSELRWTDSYAGDVGWTDFRLQWRCDESGAGGYDDLTWELLAGEGTYAAEWTPRREHISPDIRLRMECVDALGDTSYGAWASSVKVFPAGGGVSDKTMNCGVAVANWYSGEPSSSIPIDFREGAGDELDDILLTMKADSENRGVVGYRNVSAVEGVLSFRRALQSELFSAVEAPVVGSTCVVSGDLGGVGAESVELPDGVRDIIVGRADGDSARVYLNTVDLPIFKDVSGSICTGDVSASRNDKSVGMLVDADHDGLEDVLLGGIGSVYGVNSVLLLSRNIDGQIELEEHTGWPGMTAGHTFVWADSDQDGFWEVFSATDGSFRMIEELRGNQFLDRTSTLPFSIGGARSMCWVDVDHVDGMDLAVATLNQGIVILFGTVGGDGDAFSDYCQIEYPMGWDPGGLSVVDYNLDGWSDLVVSGAGENSEPMLLLSLGGHSEFGQRFVNVGSAIGLDIPADESSNTLALSDYDGDHDIDMVIPRLADVQVNGDDIGGRVYENNLLTGFAEEPNWIAFDFETGGEYLGVSSLGTMISLSSGNPILGQSVSLGRCVLDGGHGPSGQGSGVVVMGLEDYEQTVYFRLDLPRMSVIGSSPPGKTVNVRQLEAQAQLTGLNGGGAVFNPVPEIVTGTVQRSIAIQPTTGLIDWHFTWQTNVWTPPENDLVDLEGVNCSFVDPDLVEGYPGVEVSVSYLYNSDTGESTYLHEVIWYDQPCQVNCSYSFSVESITAGSTPTTLTASGSSGRIRVCPQSY